MNNNPISFSSRHVVNSAGVKRLAAVWTVAISLLGAGWANLATSGSAPRASALAARTAGTLATGPWDDAGVAWGGHTLAGLTAQFWRWNYSIPLGVNPGTETSGANCGINQVGDVWFLAGPFGTFTSSCTIPAGKRIVSAVNAFIDDYPCPYPFGPAPGQSLEEFLLQDVGPLVDGIVGAAAQLDGRPLQVKRIKSQLFVFTAAASLAKLDSCITGSPQLGVSDGYFVFIEPLPRGDHVLQLTSAGTNMGTIYLKIR
jgi:hypothetical protein